MGCKRDRQGNEISLLQWADLRDDPSYRVVREDFLIPSMFRIRTVWKGIDDVVGAMFATGMSEDGKIWTTLGETDTEAEALEMQAASVDTLRALRSAAHNTLPRRTRFS